MLYTVTAVKEFTAGPLIGLSTKSVIKNCSASTVRKFEQLVREKTVVNGTTRYVAVSSTKQA